MGVNETFGRLVGDTPGRFARGPVTARVVKVDPTGAWASPLGTSTDSPVGPCLGPSPAVGSVVLLVFTDDGPWIAAVDS
ncbi:hypothetical protein GCM10022215_17960 [Nocardioides fonticola]|uniref:Uncharacterized protein n=1 Tax=Nocardioides fonticola TaxID=450363 RepID=A0ABP7XI90_9ACTN